MSFTITRLRPQPATIERVAELRHAAFFAEGSHTLAIDRDGLWKLAARQEEDEFGLVAEIDSMVVGSVLLVRRELDQYHEVGPWLAGLVVRADWRSRGIGSALVRAVEERARLAGMTELFLYTYDADRFYRTLDWTVRERFVDNHGETCALMLRDLTSHAEIVAELD